MDHDLTIDEKRVYGDRTGAVTVLLAAVSTREEFPRWRYVAGALTGSIVVATVFLGIHWVTDVVAGAVLAVGSVAAADRIVE